MTTEAALIKIITITNPLEIGKHDTSYVVYEKGVKLIELIPEGIECVVAVSGGVVKVDQWEAYELQHDDTVVISPVLRGGEGSTTKNILRIVAFIVLAYFTAGLANGAYLGMTGFTAYAAGAAVYIAGSMLINALLPATQKMPNAEMGESSTYGTQGPQNTANEGLPVPVVYGKHIMAGNMMGVYVDSAGKTQFLSMLVNAGEGPIRGISDIRLNGEPINVFQEAVYSVGLGHSKQLQPPFFQDTYIATPTAGAVNLPTWASPVNLFEGTNPLRFIERVTSQEVDGFRLDLIAPLGLLEMDRKGNQRQYAVELRVMYKRVDANGNDIGEPWRTEMVQGLNVGIQNVFGYYDNANYNPVTAPSGGGGDGIRPMQPEVPIVIKSTGFVNQNGPAVALPAPGLIIEGADQTEFAQNATIQSTDPLDLGDGLQREQDFAAFLGPVSTVPGLFYPSEAYESDTLLPGTETNSSGEIIEVASGKVVGRVSNKATPATGTSGAANGFPGNVHFFAAKSRMPQRLVLKSPDDLEQGYYRIRIGRADAPKYEDDQNISDLVQLENVYEIITDDVSYKNTAWVSLRIRMNDQLQSLPNVTFTHEGIIIKVWDSEAQTWAWEASSNPAWVVMDMLTNTRYGAGIPFEQIDTEAFREWAHYCDTREFPLEFNGVFDQAMNIWDAMRMVCRNGHAQIVRIGSRFSVAIERADVPVMMFSEANIVKESFKQTWIGLSERANSVNVVYFDRNHNWDRKETRVVSPLITPGSEEIITEMTLYGVTSRERAIADAWLQLNLNNWVNRSVEFEATLDAIACSVGSLIAVKHVGVNYQVSGRCSADSTNNNARIYLDQMVKFQPGLQYKVLVHIPAYGAGVKPLPGMTVGSINVQNRTLRITGFADGAWDPVTVNGSRPDARKVSHIEVWASRDQSAPNRVYKVERVNTANNEFKIAEPIDDLPNGWHARAIFGDLIAERPVVNWEVDNDGHVIWVELDSTSSWLTKPKQFDHYMLGPVQNEVRKYRVISITGNGSEYTRTIMAIEYHDEIYDYSGFVMPPDPDGSAPTGPGDGSYVTSGIGHVRNPENGAVIPGSPTQERYWVPRERWLIGTDAVSIRFEAAFGWKRPLRGSYAGADVFMRMLHPKEIGWANTNGIPLLTAIGNNAWQHIATVRDLDQMGYKHVFSLAEQGSLVQFRVQAFDTAGRRPPFSSAPIIPNGNDLHIVGIIKNSSDTTVENLEAISGFRQVRLSWDVPEDQRDMYKGVIVYASAPAPLQSGSTTDYETPSNNPESATAIARVSFRGEYTHFVSDSAPRTYWIKAVDLGNDEGPFVGGVVAAALTTAAELLGGDFGDFDEYIQNIINNAPNIVRYEDYSELNDRVLELLGDYIEQAQDISRIDTSTSDFFGRVATLESEVNGANGQPSIAQRLTVLATQYDQNAAALIVEQQARSDADSAISSQLTLLTSEVDGNTAGLAQEIQTRATEDSALATSVTILGGRVGTAESAILNESQTRSTADSALAAQITSITAMVNSNEAAIQTEAQTRATEIAAEAAARSAVSAQVALKNRVYRQAATPTGTHTTGDIWYKTDSNNLLHVWTGSAWTESADARIAMAQAAIATESSTRADQTSALATQISQVNAQISDPATGLSALANSVNAIESEVSMIEGTLNSQTTEIALIQNQVSSRNRTFAQNDPPTGTTENPVRAGDLWVDTNDGNRLYRFNGVEWSEITLPRGARTTVASAAPTSPPPEIGDIWFDNSQAGGVVQYRYGGAGPGWVVMRDRQVTATATDLAQVQTQVNDSTTGLNAIFNQLTVQGTRIGEKAQTYISDSAPVAGSVPFSVGDIWIDTLTGNRLNRWSGSNWIAAPNRENSMTFVTNGPAPSAPAPRGFVTGDIWFQRQVDVSTGALAGYTQYRRAGSNWVQMLDETTRVAAERVTSLETFVSDNEATISDVNQLRAQLQTAFGTTIAATVSNLRSIALEDNGSAVARASLEVDVNGRITGYRTNNNGVSGQFDVIADRFRVLDPTNSVALSLDGAGDLFVRSVRLSNTSAALTQSFSNQNMSLSMNGLTIARTTGGSVVANPLTGIVFTSTSGNTVSLGNSFVDWNLVKISEAGKTLSITSPFGGTQPGVIVTSGNVGTYAAPPSDLRLKTDFQDITNALDIVKQINVYRHGWDYNACERIEYSPSAEFEYGVIAQELLGVVPEAVIESGYGEDHLAVRYDKLVPILIQAIKDQQAQIDELKAILLSR